MAGFPLGALRRALAERMASGGRFVSGLGKYAAVTGGIGAGVGAAMGAGYEANEEGGDPWAGARDGAIAGGMMGPVTVPATVLGTASGLIPLAGTAVLAHTLASTDQSARRAHARESLNEADAFAQMIRDQQEDEYEHMMRARFGGDEAEEPNSLRDVLRNLIEADMAAGRGRGRTQQRVSNDAMDAVRFHSRGLLEDEG